MKKLHLPAFTLVELLLAVVVFASVASFSTLTLATTVRLQASQRQTNLISSQINLAMGEMSSDVRAAATYADQNEAAIAWPYDPSFSDADKLAASSIQTAKLATSGQASRCADGTECYPADSALILTVPVLDANGLATSKFQKRIYCAEPQYASDGTTVIGKRLARLTGKPTDAFAKFLGGSAKCTTGSLASRFSTSQTFAIEYLSDTSTEIPSLRFWPVFSSLNTTTDYTHDAPAIRVEVTARYNASNIQGSDERRANDQSGIASPIVFRNLLTRNSAYTAGQQP